MKKHWIPFLLAFELPLILVFWWWGGFSQAGFELVQRGPYHYAYLSQKGDYYKLPEKQMEVLKNLQQQGVQAGAAVTLLLNDPNAPRPNVNGAPRWVIWLVQMPRWKNRLPSAACLQGRWCWSRSRPSPCWHSGKAYSALLAYLEERHLKLNLPTLELYQDGVLTLEAAQ